MKILFQILKIQMKKNELFEQAIHNCLINQDELTSQQTVAAIKALYNRGIKPNKESIEELDFWKDDIL